MLSHLLCFLAIVALQSDAFRHMLRPQLKSARVSSRVMCESGAGSLNPEEVVGSNATPMEGVVPAMMDIPAERITEFNGIRQYKEIFGNLQVPADFVVPTADFSWPEETWGMPLGKVVDTIKNTDEYDVYKAELEKIGFRYSLPKAANNEQTMEEAQKDFDVGNIITIALYSWIAYLAYDTARIVFFSGPPPS